MHAHLFKYDKLAFATVPRRQRATGCASNVASHNSNASASRDEVATLMLDLESSLPSMSCSQLASTITGVHCSYKAAVLGVEAGQSELDEVVEYYTSELPDHSWLLTFRARELQAVVRGLLFLGAAPSEPWLKALVEVVRLRAAELPCKDVQGFVEGFRFFGTKLSKAAWLRDATAQLEEFTLN
eukprot:gene4169-4417_t